MTMGAIAVPAADLCVARSRGHSGEPRAGVRGSGEGDIAAADRSGQHLDEGDGVAERSRSFGS